MRFPARRAVSIVVVWFCIQPGGLTAQRYGAPYPSAGSGRSSTLVPRAALEYRSALTLLSQESARLEKELDARTPEARTQLQQIRTDAMFLAGKWITWAQRHPQELNYGSSVEQDSYYKSVKGSHRELKRLRGAGDDEIARVVEAIAADLRAKAENCRNSEDGLGRQIRVTVHTKKATAEVAGFEVWFVPIALLAYGDEHQRFPRISSPTVLNNLAPGRYALWARKDGLETDRIPQTIGGKGQSELEIDLLVP